MDRKLLLIVLDGVPLRNWTRLFGNLEGWVQSGEAQRWTMRSVLPSISASCYASIHTGVTPQVHGCTGNGNVFRLSQPDIFSQVLYGGRTALAIGFLAAIMVTVIGTNVGLVSGYFGGRTDSVLMRIVDIMYALPLEPFAMILVLVWRPGVGVIILAVGLLTWRTTARLIRSQVLSIVRRPFVKAARMAGSGHARIMYVHIAPNVLPLTFLQLAVAMAFAITAEATLSFLGLGPPRLYSWGTILHQARLSGAWRTAWWWIVPPGVLIMITVVSVFFVSRALEVVANPRLRRQ